MDRDSVQALFDAANARASAGSFALEDWKRFVREVEASTAGGDPERATVLRSAAVQMGCQFGLVDPETDVEAALR